MIDLVDANYWMNGVRRYGVTLSPPVKARLDEACRKKCGENYVATDLKFYVLDAGSSAWAKLRAKGRVGFQLTRRVKTPDGRWITQTRDVPLEGDIGLMISQATFWFYRPNYSGEWVWRCRLCPEIEWTPWTPEVPMYGPFRGENDSSRDRYTGGSYAMHRAAHATSVEEEFLKQALVVRQKVEGRLGDLQGWELIMVGPGTFAHVGDAPGWFDSRGPLAGVVDAREGTPGRSELTKMEGIRMQRILPEAKK